MALRDVFRDLFRDPMAERELATLGHHIAVPTFNLSTTSLRHINKWYDRLREIAKGSHSDHPNFYSDPESLGLIERISGRGRLTRAGELLLSTAPTLRTNPARAEFELIKILYYSGLSHRPAVDEFLNGKRQNLLRFLSDCHLTANSELLLQSPKLLAIAESLPRFPGALHRFLELRSADLTAIGALGEAGFSSLWNERQPPAGLGRLARKIGGDYTRAEERRLYYLVSMTLLEIRKDLLRSGRLFDEIRLPQPFSNLVTPAFLISVHAAYTDEIRIAEEDNRILVFLDPRVVTAPAVPTVTKIGIRVPKRHSGRKGSKEPKVRQPSTRQRMIDQVLAKEAEDYVERAILRPKHGRFLVRAGHTDREFVLLSDGFVPGADFYATEKNPKRGIYFYEVKSAINNAPASIRITRAEYTRAKKCHGEGLPYEIYIVIFLKTAPTPKVLHIPDFAAIAVGLTIDHVVAFDIALNL
jgi:hypothetical protein